MKLKTILEQKRYGLGGTKLTYDQWKNSMHAHGKPRFEKGENDNEYAYVNGEHAGTWNSKEQDGYVVYKAGKK